MGLESNFVCEGKGIKRDASGCGCASPDVRIQKKRLFCFRDLPVGVGLPQGMLNESIRDSVRLEVRESIQDCRLRNTSKQKVESSDKAAELSETVVQAAAKMYPPPRKIMVQGCFPQGFVAKNHDAIAKASADFGPNKKVESNDKVVELPEKDAELAESIYPPWKKALVIRHFPQICVAKNPEINAGMSLASATFRTEQKTDLSNKKPELPEKVDQTPRTTISVTRCFPQGFASNISQNNPQKTLTPPNQRNEQRDAVCEHADVVPQTAKEMKLPHRKISATRSFPQGCSKHDPEINSGQLSISTDFRTERKVKQNDRAAQLSKSVAQTMMKTHSPQRAISVTRSSNGFVPRDSQIRAGVSPLFFDGGTEQKLKVQLSDEAVELTSQICTNFKNVKKVETSDKNVELPERVAQTAEKAHSPPSCVPENSQIKAGMTLTHSDFGTEQQERNVRNTLVENDAEPITDNQHQRNMKSSGKITKTQSNYDSFEAERETWSKNDIEKGAYRLSSSRKKKTFKTEEASIDSEKPTYRVTVMGLMASTNYQSMQKKRVKK